VDKEIKTLLHPPKALDIFNQISNSGLALTELEELIGNEAFLKDFLLNTEAFKAFALECDSLVDQA
jgi:hypothetical protein